MSDETKKVSEAKGPYSKNNYVGSPPGAYRIFNDRVAMIANLAHAEGRASRDGLREELERLLDVVCDEDHEIITKLLEADGEGEK